MPNFLCLLWLLGTLFTCGPQKESQIFFPFCFRPQTRWVHSNLHNNYVQNSCILFTSTHSVMGLLFSVTVVLSAIVQLWIHRHCWSPSTVPYWAWDATKTSTKNLWNNPQLPSLQSYRLTKWVNSRLLPSGLNSHPKDKNCSFHCVDTDSLTNPDVKAPWTFPLCEEAAAVSVILPVKSGKST